MGERYGRIGRFGRFGRFGRCFRVRASQTQRTIQTPFPGVWIIGNA